MKKQPARKKNDGGAGAVLGVGILASLAGAYFLYGAKDAAKNRKKVKAWALKAKAEVVEKLDKMSEATEEEYAALVDKVMAKYSALKSVDTMEAEALAKDLKKHWKAIQRDIKLIKKA
jgi:hypothetical protein